MSLTAKVQDEVGHGHMLYRVAEDLGKSRDAMIADLIAGRTKFHNVFHYPTYTWGDVAVIGYLIDGAALVTQKALLDSSYAPYVRVLKRICAEESLHQRHGEDLVLELCGGHRRAAPDVPGRGRPLVGADHAVLRHRPRPAGADVLLEWRPEGQVQRGAAPALLRHVRAQAVGPRHLSVPDPALQFNEAKGEWDWTEPNWDTFWQVVKGNGPMTETRLAWRRWMHEAHAWVREALATTPTAA